jgi:hypothetical protein
MSLWNLYIYCNIIMNSNTRTGLATKGIILFSWGEMPSKKENSVVSFISRVHSIPYLIILGRQNNSSAKYTNYYYLLYPSSKYYIFICNYYRQNKIIYEMIKGSALTRDQRCGCLFRIKMFVCHETEKRRRKDKCRYLLQMTWFRFDRKNESMKLRMIFVWYFLNCP